MGEKLQGKWAVYAGLEKIGRISTIDEDGTPHTTPVFYAQMDGEIYFGTQRPRRKFRNIERNPRVCFCIDTPESPYKGMTIQGTATVVDDEATHARFRDALMFRYYGHPDSPGWQYIQSLGQSVLIRIDADKILTWDFSGD